MNSILILDLMYSFLILDLHERAALLEKEGVFLMNARLDEFSFSLYAFKNFYVEIVLNNAENRITRIVPFISGWRLDKYLSDIEITDELLIYHK